MKDQNKSFKVSKKIRKGDKVIALAGNFKGQTGTVLSCLGDKVIVQGLNVRKRHTKGQGNQPGRIVELEKPIHISNLSVCSDDNQPLKLKVRFENGERQLYYKKDGTDVLYRSLKKSSQ